MYKKQKLTYQIQLLVLFLINLHKIVSQVPGEYSIDISNKGLDISRIMVDGRSKIAATIEGLTSKTLTIDIEDLETGADQPIPVLLDIDYVAPNKQPLIIEEIFDKCIFSSILESFGHYLFFLNSFSTSGEYQDPDSLGLDKILNIVTINSQKIFYTGYLGGLQLKITDNQCKQTAAPTLNPLMETSQFKWIGAHRDQLLFVSFTFDSPSTNTKIGYYDITNYSVIQSSPVDLSLGELIVKMGYSNTPLISDTVVTSQYRDIFSSKLIAQKFDGGFNIQQEVYNEFVPWLVREFQEVEDTDVLVFIKFKFGIYSTRLLRIEANGIVFMNNTIGSFHTDPISEDVFRRIIVLPEVQGVAYFQGKFLKIQKNGLCYQKEVTDTGNAKESCNTCSAILDDSACITCHEGHEIDSGSCRVIPPSVPDQENNNSTQNDSLLHLTVVKSFINVNNSQIVVEFGKLLDPTQQYLIKSRDSQTTIPLFEVRSLTKNNSLKINDIYIRHSKIIFQLDKNQFHLESRVSILPNNLIQNTASPIILSKDLLSEYKDYPIVVDSIQLDEPSILSKIFHLICKMTRILISIFMIFLPNHSIKVIKLLQIIDFLPLIKLEEYPPKFKYVISSLSAVLSDTIPNILKYDESDSDCQLNTLLVEEGIGCSLINNIGHFFTILVVFAFIKLIIHLCFRVTFNRNTTILLSKIDCYFGLGYLIFISFNLEMDLLLSIAVFFKESGMNSLFSKTELWVAICSLLILLLGKIVYWTVHFIPKYFKDLRSFSMISHEFMVRPSPARLVLHLVSQVLKDGLLPVLIILFLENPTAQILSIAGFMFTTLIFQVVYPVIRSTIEKVYHIMSMVFYVLVTSIYLLIDLGLINSKSSIVWLLVDIVLVTLFTIMVILIIFFMALISTETITETYQAFRGVEQKKMSKINKITMKQSNFQTGRKLNLSKPSKRIRFKREKKGPSKKIKGKKKKRGGLRVGMKKPIKIQII